MLSWCPSCQISIGEVSLPNYELQFGAKPFDLNPSTSASWCSANCRRWLTRVSDTLATIYHACHREICDVGNGRSFEVVNFMELLGEGLGLDSDDLYKRLKLIGDIDEIIESKYRAADRGAPGSISTRCATRSSPNSARSSRAPARLSRRWSASRR